MSHFYRAFGWAYAHWGTMSTLIVGLIAFILSLRPSVVAKLEQKPAWKFGIPVLVGCIAITGYIASESSTANLESQINAMYQQTRLEATRSDIQSLGTYLASAFGNVMRAVSENQVNVEQAINRIRRSKPVAAPPKPQSKSPSASPSSAQIPPPNVAVPSTIAPIASPPQITVTQASALPSDAAYKYGLQVTIQSNESLPVSFAIQCTGAIGEIKAFLVGQGVYLSKLTGVRGGNTAIVRFGYPPLTPQSPLVVVLSSNDNIRALKVYPYEQ